MTSMNNNRGNEINLSANIESIRAKEGAFKGLEDQLIKVMTTIIKAQEVQQAAKETVEHALGDVSKADQKQADKDSRKDSYAKGSAAAGEASNAIQSILKNTFSIIQSMYQRLISASPLLQSIETLFNLAVQLFFMPLGTKLATEMLPAVMDLVENVMKIWDGFDNKTLGDLLGETIEMGAEIFGEYFDDIGERLADEGGLLGAIGKSLQLIGNIISSNGATILTKIVAILSYIVENFPTLIGILVAFKTIQIGLAAANLIANLTTASAVVAITGGLAAIGTGIGAAAWASTVYAAEGGYFPAKEGGTHVVLAEGGEGEYVVPESKMAEFAEATLSGYSPRASVDGGAGMGGQVVNNYYNTFNGYTDNDILEIVRREVSDQIKYSRLRGGF